LVDIFSLVLHHLGMKIGIDTCGCNQAAGGAGSYIRSIIKNLPKSGEFTFELFGLEAERFEYTSGIDIPFTAIPDFKNLKEVQKWHKYKAAKFIQRNKYDAVLFPNPEKIHPVTGKFTSVAVINSQVSGIHDRKVRKNLGKALKNVSKIIAVSEFIEKDLISNGFDKEKINVVHNGIDHTVFYPVMDLDDDILDIKPFAIKRPYFLSCTSLSGPQKKHIELIKAFEIFKAKNQTAHRLVIAGYGGEYAEKVQKAAYNSEFAEDIFITGFYPFESLAKLYAGSDGCVVTAVNEGAGLPVLEAMACGVPVMCSDSGALPEVGGLVPLYFNSEKPDEIAVSMEKVISDKELCSKMVDSGIKRASEFNWKATVAETLNVLK